MITRTRTSRSRNQAPIVFRVSENLFLKLLTISLHDSADTLTPYDCREDSGSSRPPEPLANDRSGRHSYRQYRCLRMGVWRMNSITLLLRIMLALSVLLLLNACVPDALTERAPTASIASTA